jgi:two-component system response regulator HydG
VRPLGSSDDVPVDVRVVAATSQDVRAACAKGTFRLDLYYRLSGIVLHVPALRERRDDVLLLARWLLNQEAPELELTAAAAEALALAPWPGNVRELKQALTHAMVQVSADDARQIRAEHLPVLRAPETNDHPATSLPAIKQALAETNGNASAAAKLLGISRATLYNVLRRQGVEPSAARSR